MNTYFYIVAISLSVVLILGNFYTKKKATSRNFAFDYAIEEKRLRVSWKTFILPAVFFLLSFIKGIDIAMVLFSIILLLAISLDIFQSKKQKHKSYLIRGTKLIYNGWRVKEFELIELESIRFLPFSDSFKLIFKTNKSIVIPRLLFDRNILSNFIQKAIQFSPGKIKIDEDAKTKIYN
ncbi:MAG: hypothetical protein IPI88_18855 [Chitinophagaceae bacterium]|nr:hypothetical protein [Chitinophagaceae bacterium]